ncbi:putative estradiol 17 beta-dehydrogenase [Planoprotostelium fungivorum]|uniref:Putative estradiol 17 beta-dehydrogenase n=1 Tax=Planoprotostelium fungivorum TaxID=1890364 RepID=A0A2P6NNU8_9EUKA|nr:putative estradiol 17 beta-dehydrogenase [Planoprotostelium fungivorum]
MFGLPAGKSKMSNKSAKNAEILQKVKECQFQEVVSRYDEKDAILYALSVGEGEFGGTTILGDVRKELKVLLSELFNSRVLFPFSVLDQMIGSMGDYNPMMILHGEQYLELNGPLPLSATVKTSAEISAIQDKGKGALIVVKATTRDASNNKILEETHSTCRTWWSRQCESRHQVNSAVSYSMINPFQWGSKGKCEYPREKTSPGAAIFYRMMGDRNPLHCDPNLAAVAGFDQPILHGLCTFGHAGRAVLHHFCDNDVSRFRSIQGRFLKVVYPGETIITQMWREGNKILFQSKVEERPDGNVLVGAVEIVPRESKL